MEEEEYAQLKILKERLVQLNDSNLVKINHSVMELICAKHLILNGFQVEVEHTINGISCDIFARKGYEQPSKRWKLGLYLLKTPWIP